MQRDPQAFEQLSRTLQPAAARLQAARAAVQSRRAAVVAVRSVPRLAAWLAVVVVALSLVMALPPWLPPLLLLLAAAFVFLLLRAQATPARADVEDGALACDRANDNQDRLSAACELAGAPPAESPPTAMRESLAQAAIDDGVASLRRIDAARLSLPAAPDFPSLLPSLLCLGLVALLPLLLPAPAGTASDAAPVADAGSAGGPADQATRRPADSGERAATEPLPMQQRERPAERKPAAPKAGTPPPPKPAEPAPAVPAASGQGQSGSDAAGDSTQTGAPKAAPTGNPGTGQSGGGQGSAASGAPEPSPNAETPKAASKPKKPKPQKDQPQQDGKPSESAGAPSGPSRGSGRMSAVGNKRNDLNRGQEREDDPEVEDEPVEDESEEQEQRGGVMPMRRGDNRPAARELSISGDGPPDQGRGGPTPPKKSRGTASLVLGLRLPDSVRGQPNPGTAKTSLEQIPPRPSTADPGLARAVPAGRPTTPQSQRRPSSLLSLQRAYHALLRAQDSAVPPASQHPPADSPKDPR